MNFKYLDEYDFRARFVPSIFITLPALFAAFALVPSLRSFIGLVVGPTIELVIVFVLVRIARDQGKKIEPQLVHEWDGMPTTRYLRSRNDEVEPLTRDRYRAFLTKLTGINFPTAEQEAVDPAGADAAYSSAIAILREHRRDKKYRLAFGENCNYGMMRNLRGLRRLGIAISSFAALAVGAGLFLPTTSRDLAMVTMLVCALVFMMLVWFASNAVVKRTSEAYANALLGTCLATSATPKKIAE